MNPIDTLLTLASAFADHRKLSESRVSTIVFGDGTRLKHLRQGGDMGARRVDRAIVWFSTNWPEALAWPSDIVRSPLPVVDAQAGPAAAGDPPPAAALCVGNASERPVHVDSS